MINAKSSGADLQWLENALSQAFKERPRKVSKFDAQLAEKLKRFQLAEGYRLMGWLVPRLWYASMPAAAR